MDGQIPSDYERSMRKRVLVGCLALCACAAAQPVPSSAPAGSGAVHQVKRVKVAEGVELEVLDFGGQGPALVFLAGLGSTAHVFDELAPEFTAQRHVWALTRRGFGSSSWPEKGYDTATLGTDVLHALDSLGVTQASLVGHSLAGDELTWVGIHHPERVEKLIYLDAALERARLRKLLEGQPSPPEPAINPADLTSRAALSDAIAREVGGRFPAEEIEQGSVFEPTTGHVLRARHSPEAVRQIREGAAELDFSALRVPVLSLYVLYVAPSQEEAFTGFDLMSPGDQEKMRPLLPRVRQILTGTQEVLRKVPGSRVVALERASHYVWLTNHAEVVREMKAFLTLPTPHCGKNKGN